MFSENARQSFQSFAQSANKVCILDIYAVYHQREKVKGICGIENSCRHKHRRTAPLRPALAGADTEKLTQRNYIDEICVGREPNLVRL